MKVPRRQRLILIAVLWAVVVIEHLVLPAFHPLRLATGGPPSTGSQPRWGPPALQPTWFGKPWRTGRAWVSCGSDYGAALCSSTRRT